MFDESKHPRDDYGRFTNKNGSGVGFGELVPGRGEPYRKSAAPEVTKREWAEWYHAVGEIKRGMWYPKASKGYLIQINNKIFITSGTYLKPKAEILAFEDKNEAEDAIRRFLYEK